MSFAIVIEGMNLIVYIIILAGGKQKRVEGWKFLAALHMIVAALQVAAMAIIVSLNLLANSAMWRLRWVGAYDPLKQAYLYENDDRFFPGWALDSSWINCTVSWSVQFLLACGICAAAIWLPIEGGYELIPEDDFGEME